MFGHLRTVSRPNSKTSLNLNPRDPGRNKSWILILVDYLIWMASADITIKSANDIWWQNI